MRLTACSGNTKYGLAQTHRWTIRQRPPTHGGCIPQRAAWQDALAYHSILPSPAPVSNIPCRWGMATERVFGVLMGPRHGCGWMRTKEKGGNARLLWKRPGKSGNVVISADYLDPRRIVLWNARPPFLRRAIHSSREPAVRAALWSAPPCRRRRCRASCHRPRANTRS